MENGIGIYSLDINGKTIYDEEPFDTVKSPTYGDSEKYSSAEAETFYNSLLFEKETGLFGLVQYDYPDWTINNPSALLSRLQTAGSASVSAPDVVLSPQKLAVDGKNIDCEKYNIGGANYFKLRDLAWLLNGTGSRFAVGFDAATSTVSITTGAAYTPNGTELVAGVDNSATAQPSRQTILINGVKRGDLSVYNIGGSNFFKLRDLGTALGFDVDYDAASNTAIVRSRQK